MVYLSSCLWPSAHCFIEGFMATSSKRVYVICCKTQVCCKQSPCPHGRPLLTQATARFLETHRPVWLSVLWGHCSFLLSPGVHKVLFVSSKSVFPVLWKFCNQIPLASKVKFPGGSQFLCWILRLGNLLWTLELLQQCQDIFCIIVLQFVGHLLSGPIVS